VEQIWPKTRIAPVCLIMALLLFSPGRLAGQKPKSLVLTNTDVLQMFKAGIPASIIVAKIKHSQTDFDTSTKALIALKAARLPDPVIMAMVNAVPVKRRKPTSTPGIPPAKLTQWITAQKKTRTKRTSNGNSQTATVSTLRTSVPVEPAMSTSPSGSVLPTARPTPGGQANLNQDESSRIPSTSPGTRANVAWEPEFDMDRQLYPSMVLELEGNSNRLAQHSPAYYIGDPIGMAGVKILCQSTGEQVSVQVRIDGLSNTSTLSTTLQQPGHDYYIYPVIRYDTTKLERVSESYPTTVEYSVQVAGKSEAQKTISIQVHSVNDVPFAIALRSGKVKSLSPLFAGFVDENDPFIQSLLQQALAVHAVNQFDGYQSGPQGVEMQVFAIWNALQRRRIHYSSTATASAESPWGWVSVGEPDGHVLSQTVRFLDQSISNQQANCIDGAVLFASALYKIGIDPVLVILPGHAFVGYYVDPQHHHPQFLETTLIGRGKMPLNLKFGLLYQITATASWREFLYAIQYGNQEFMQKVRPNLGRNPQYMLIDIQKVRQAGINPIPRPF
jgi:hypothetical protein